MTLTASIIDGLYRQMLFVALILLAILLLNNIVLYKQKLSDRLSIMLLCSVSMCAFEILWEFCSGTPALCALSYLGACGYAISFILLSVELHRYILSRFDNLPKKKWQNRLFYLAPVVIFCLLCITTPWTHWLFRVDESGALLEMELFSVLFIPLLMVYLLSALAQAVYVAVRRRKEDPGVIRVAKSMIVFGVLTPAVYLIQILLLGPDSDYLALSLAVAVSFVYLVTNVSTHALMETQAHAEAVAADLRLATKIQSSMLPNIFPAFPDRSEFDIYASMDPAKEVGGDFYDFFLVDPDHLCIVIADVSGKGVPAALFMMASKIILQSNAMLGQTPAEILTKTNEAVCSNNPESMFVTVWLGILELSTGKLTAANAGHEYPILKEPDGNFAIYKDKHGLVIGGMDGVRYREYELQLQPGSKLFLYTDGVPEATSADKELFGVERTVGALNARPDASPEQLLKNVRNAVDSFVQEAEQFDDLTMLCLEYRGRSV